MQMNLFHSLHPLVSLYVLIGKNPKVITPMWVGVSQTVSIYLGSGRYLNKSFPVATCVSWLTEQGGLGKEWLFLGVVYGLIKY